MDITFLKVTSDRQFVDCYSASGNFLTRIHPATALPISLAVIQGDRIVIQGSNGRTDIHNLYSGNHEMSI